MDFNSIFSFEPVSYIIIIVTVNLLYTMTHTVIYSLNKTQKDVLLPYSS
jgi:hypothetical protein